MGKKKKRTMCTGGFHYYWIPFQDSKKYIRFNELRHTALRWQWGTLRTKRTLSSFLRDGGAQEGQSKLSVAESGRGHSFGELGVSWDRETKCWSDISLKEAWWLWVQNSGMKGVTYSLMWYGSWTWGPTCLLLDINLPDFLTRHTGLLHRLWVGLMTPSFKRTLMTGFLPSSANFEGGHWDRKAVTCAV